MKKMLFVAIALCALTLVSCGKKDKGNEKSSTSVNA